MVGNCFWASQPMICFTVRIWVIRSVKIRKSRRAARLNHFIGVSFKRHAHRFCSVFLKYCHRAAKRHALSDPFSHHTPHLTFLTLIFPHSILYIYFFHDNKPWSSACRSSSNSDWLTEIRNPRPIHQSFVPKSNQPRKTLRNINQSEAT